ncbi:hypothetical protein [Kordiimonas aestuarii]|uniref:hypothetical protein n=1 Tax=Kordiimonas aestuarii TaxID=1005925 RepID=UPI0021D3905A|nr:hypothetical protein [Kordiimonas aestuarii]
MFIELLKEVEACVLEKKYADARKPLNKIFELVEAGKVGFGGQSLSVGIISEKEATRLASAITQLLTDTSFDPAVGLLLELNRFKRALVQVFEISGYRGTDHLINMFGQREGKQHTYRRTELLRMFAGISINAMNDVLLSLLLKLDPTQSFPTMLGFLSEQMVYTKQAEDIRSRLLELSDHWKDVNPQPYTIYTMGPPYMGCSYAEASHKHDIKRCFNNVIRNWLAKQKITDRKLPTKRMAKKRPKLVIFAELYNSSHAMHRCYGPSIRALKKDFDTTLLLTDVPANAELKALAHTVETVKFKHNKPKDLIDKILSYKPDVIYYPSIGMRFSTITLSTIRLAPIQVMTFGHPATTKSDAIDYVILSDEQIGSDTTVTEKVMLRPTKPFFTHRSDAANIPAEIRLDPEVVRIAVPAWSRKVTPTFLNTCRRIRDLAKKPVEFWFFPNSSGALQQALMRRYSEIMPHDKVLPRTNYNDYIANLNKCDIFLSTFPFGATNGIVDAALQGLPIVNMTGPEVHTANDSSLVKELAQPDWLTVDSEDGFVKAVVRLVNNPGERVQISHNILANDPDKAFFVEDDADAWEFNVIMDYLYRNHEVIQASEQKSWHYEEIFAEAGVDMSGNPVTAETSPKKA